VDSIVLHLIASLFIIVFCKIAYESGYEKGLRTIGGIVTDIEKLAKKGLGK